LKNILNIFKKLKMVYFSSSEYLLRIITLSLNMAEGKTAPERALSLSHS
jgi:hypothetical protein